MKLTNLWENKKTRIALLAGGVLLAAFAAFMVAGAADDTPGWVPAPFASDTGGLADGGQTPDGTGSMASAPGAKPVSNGTAASGNGATGDDGAPGGDTDDAGTPPADATDDPATDDPANDPADDPATDDPADDPAPDTMTLRILYWNDTRDKAPAGLRVAVGGVTWSPTDGSAEKATGKLTGLPFETALQLDVYPDGTSGTRISVPILLTEDMISDSEGDAVHVEIKDGTVRVLGTPVDNFDVTQDRF